MLNVCRAGCKNVQFKLMWTLTFLRPVPRGYCGGLSKGGVLYILAVIFIWRKFVGLRITQIVTACFRLGVDVDNLSDLDSDSDSEDAGAYALPPGGTTCGDSGTMSEPHSSQSEGEGHSDSGVESVEGQHQRVTHRLEHMDIDMDDSLPHDSAMLNVGDKCGSSSVDTETDTAAAANASWEGTGARPKTTRGLLAVLPPPTSGPTSDSTATIEDPSTVDLDQYASVEQLEALGLDTLKAVLISRGLKCGGTLQQRAERLFSVKGLAPDQISPALLAKPAKGRKKK